MKEQGEYERRIRRNNTIAGIAIVLVVFVLQVLICALTGVNPHWGPI